MIVTCEVCGKKNRVPAAASGTPHCGNCGEPLPWIAEAGSTNFGEIAERSVVPVLVDLWAPWCGPCRMVSPALEQLAREFRGRVKLVKVNVDDAADLATRFAVMGIPTLLVLQQGQVVERQTGAAPLPALRAWLEGALKKLDVGAQH